MIIKPKCRGFICTTAHPEGCMKNVTEQIEYIKSRGKIDGAKRILIIGSSTGYGLASRIAGAYGMGADTVGVYFDRISSETKTGTPGWYNNRAFENSARKDGLIAESINGDAYSSEIKQATIDLIKNKLPGGKVDLIIYSLASPKRTDPVTGESYRSVIKPIGTKFENKTIDFHTGIVSDISVEPADENEIKETVAVMGGDDWMLWMEALKDADVIAKNAITLSYSYIGPVLTHAIYKNGTIGMAKSDLETKAREITDMLSYIDGKAFVSVNKALVTQASSAIPVVPLYISILYKVMKENNTHEGCIEQIYRLYKDRLYKENTIPTDEEGRIRIDDLEMSPEVQEKADKLWNNINSENASELSDLEGYRKDFFSLFGFGRDDVDYDADISPL